MDLYVDPEGSSTLTKLMLLMHIDKLGLFIHLYGCLFNCITMWQGSWAGTAALCIEVGLKDYAHYFRLNIKTVLFYF